MKKRILSSALCLLLLFCSVTSATAAQPGDPGFYDIGSAEGILIEVMSSSEETVDPEPFDVDGDGVPEEFFPGSARLRVTVSAAEFGKRYMLRLMDSETAAVLFADQLESRGLVCFSVAFLLPDRQAKLMLTISSDDAGFDTLTVPLAYTPCAKGDAAEPEPTPAALPEPAQNPQPDASGCPRDETCVMALFSDLDRTAWYHDGIHFVLENGIMNGYDGGRFAPGSATSRAMLVTMLWRMAGKPTGGDAVFTDVPDSVWYTEAVGWAASVQLVAGYGDQRFGPDDPVTREQLATILYRYIRMTGGGFSEAWNYEPGFSDLDHVADWAYEAVCWMTMNGILQGTEDHMLLPRETATRAQVATMLMRCYG